MYRRKDSFYQRAKESGFRSRAAFKLIELARTEKLFRPGHRVVDLGAWPGGWVQIAAPAVGPRGRVVAVDLRPIPSLGFDNVVTIAGDVGTAEVQEQVWTACGGMADVLLSDLAPSLTGIRARDEAEASELLEIVLAYAARGLKPGGTLLTKLFMSGEFKRSTRAIEALFSQLRIIRPEATRKGSAELYALARGKRAEVAAADAPRLTEQ